MINIPPVLLELVAALIFIEFATIVAAMFLFKRYLKTYQGGWPGLAKDILGYTTPMLILAVIGAVGFKFVQAGQFPNTPFLVGASLVAAICFVVINLPPIKAGRQRHLALVRARKARNRW
ncbi:hypothetical protein QO010_000730 [Caulobacter ginsengisoli]|uniref:Uncharacterized protein n=1 Tax=Caulobacter ginsengisoli TaxID=400775 RepID=A0ABU0ILU1_9CAUL|nr:hypothetical protein [Caulobacter ginsengisoli]MDQ0462982.1 hypothetical protein [Caulobacter ginsengisoli]